MNAALPKPSLFSLPQDLEHLRAADRAGTRHSAASALHLDFHGIFHLPLFLALHAIPNNWFHTIACYLLMELL